MDADPKRVEQTSPERFDDDEKTLIRRYPTAIEPTDIMATAESPLILDLPPPRSKTIAHKMVTGKTKVI